MCVRGYIDLGTYFMSVVHEVQWKVEQWAGVPPDVTTVMRALREGLGEELPSLQGRYETGYGLSDRFPIEQGLGQGCLLSPARSKLMLAVMQRTVSKLCRGFDFTAAGESVPQLVYADDGLFLSNDIATMQLALECAWLVTKICGNSLQVKKKKKTGVVSDVLGEQRRAGCRGLRTK